MKRFPVLALCLALLCLSACSPDWPSDPRLRDLSDEFLLGRSLLVAPVLEEGTVRQV